MRPLLLLTAALLLPACEPEGCLRGNDDTCVVPPACPDLAFTCSTTAATLSVIGDTVDPNTSTTRNALAATGDIVLRNDQVVAVIEALDHPHYLGPTGGNLVDLSNVGADNDSLRQILTVVGLLPDDAPRWTELRTFEEADGSVAVQVSGALDGRPGVRIVQRYTLGPCDPGVRIRTEVINESDDPLSMLVGDGFYWGSRESLAFHPSPGAGFLHPSFGLTTIGTALRTVPWMAGAAHVEPAAAYASVGCVEEELQGFQSEEVGLLGVPKRVVMPRDYVVFERFLAVAPGAGVAAAADIAYEVRRQLFEEPFVTLTGVVNRGEKVPADVQIVISEGSASTPAEERIPRSHAVPAADGTFSARVPPGRDYLVEVEAFGQVVATATVAASTTDPDEVQLDVPEVGELVLNATVDGVEDLVLAIVRPATDAEEDELLSTFLGHFKPCAPLLGNPFANSPACDRVLVDGPTRVLLPPGDYDVFAVAGPFTSLARISGVTITAGASEPVAVDLDTLPLQPSGTLSADFHVHAAASFDSSLGDRDRVRALAAARLDVVAATEHDANSNLAGC